MQFIRVFWHDELHARLLRLLRLLLCPEPTVRQTRTLTVRGKYGTLKAVNSSANPSMASTCRSPQPGRPNPCRAELLARGAGSSIDLAISSSFQLLSSVVLPSSRWPTLRNPLATVDKQLQLHHPRTHAPKVCRHAPFTALPVRSWRSFTPATRAPCGFCRAQLTSLSGCQVLLRRPSPSSLIL